MLSLAAAAGCRGSASGPFRDAPVVLVSIDTLRSDRLPGLRLRERVYAIDAIAREGIVFDRVSSHCPLTLPAGLLPPHHGVRDNMGFTLDASHRTLATRFKEAGFATGGAVSAYVLRRATGIAQGFELYHDALVVDSSVESLGAQQRDGAVATEALGRWIESQGDCRFFALLHLYEPQPRTRRRPSTATSRTPTTARWPTRTSSWGGSSRACARGGSSTASSSPSRPTTARGSATTASRSTGSSSTARRSRCRSCCGCPARAAGRRVAGLVAQVDVAPTLLDLAGLPHDGMDGVSQRAALGDGEVPPRSVYSETWFPRYHFGWSELRSVAGARHHYVRAPRPELFDLREDPGEKSNLVAVRASEAAAMAEWLETEVETGEAQKPAEVPDETREALQALGYLVGGAAVPGPGPLADPKDKLPVYEACRRAMEARRNGGRRKPSPGCAPSSWTARASWTPGRRSGRRSCGSAARRRASRRSTRSSRRDPENAAAHLALAKVHGLAGRRAEAERHAELASQKEPGRGFEVLAQLLLDQNPRPRRRPTRGRASPPTRAAS